MAAFLQGIVSAVWIKKAVKATKIHDQKLIYFELTLSKLATLYR